MMHHTTAQNKDYKLCIYPAYREKERKRRIPDQRSKESKKWKGSNSQSMEEREQKIFIPDKFSAR